MKVRRARRIAATLWVLYGVLSLAGLAILAEALFIPRHPHPFKLAGLPRTEPASSLPVLATQDGLAGKPMTRRIQGTAALAQAKATVIPIESLIRLSGIMDFGGKQPSLAVIEILGGSESKAYKSGDKIGETGVRVQEIGE
ncbi:MAG TPA: hypothetical protein VG457_18370, partial [Planctomycetota bacterium]|nr:hypothetical protein [Planctomycetota bacterium]